jgi:sarcosine oxidase subunit gamma
VLPEGGQVVADVTERVPVPMQGHVTSSYFSANLKRSIALALVQNGRNRMGEKVRVSMPGGRALSPPSRIPYSSIPQRCGRMADTILRESPLARFRLDARATHATSGAGLIVRERPFLGHVNLRGDPRDPHFAGAVGGVLGDALPMVPNSLADVNGITIYWLGPDEWLVVTPDDRREAILRRLRQALATLHVAITDVSGGQTALHLHGRNVREVLAKGCPIDFHPRVFAIGQCAQSHLGKAPILIGQVEEQPYFELIVRRSFADYLWTWLESAARNTVSRSRYEGGWRWPTAPRTETARRDETARRNKTASGNKPARPGALRSRLHAPWRRRHLRVDSFPCPARRDRRHPHCAPRPVLRGLRQGHARHRRFLHFDFGALSSHPRARMEAWREEYLAKQIEPIILPKARELIASHEARGHVTAIVTAANSFLTAPIAQMIGVQHLLASDPEIAEGEYTGKIAGIPCFHEGKIQKLEAWLESRGEALSDFPESYFYGDSQSDVPLMEKVTHPVRSGRMRRSGESRGRASGR